MRKVVHLLLTRKKMSGLNNRNIVKTSHELNHFRGGYTPTELDFIYAFISTIKREDADLQDYSLTLVDLKKKLGKRLQLSKIEYIFDSLVTKSFKINNENELAVYSFFSMLHYNKKDSVLTVSFNPKLKPHLLQLQTYAMGNLRYILQFRGEYTKRIYMLLSQWQTARKVTYELDDLREMLAIPEAYLYGQIKQKIILTAQAELRKKAPFYFSFEVGKDGKKVTTIQFKLIKNDIEMSAFQDLIREEHYDKRLYEFDGRMTLCDSNGRLYWINDDGNKVYFSDEYSLSCWKILLQKKSVLPIFRSPSLFEGIE